VKGWAFHLGELALVASLPKVEPELRGQIVEVIGMPVPAEFEGTTLPAYRVQHKEVCYFATEAALRKLPPPGTRPCDTDYDGREATSYDPAIWIPSPRKAMCPTNQSS